MVGVRIFRIMGQDLELRLRFFWLEFSYGYVRGRCQRNFPVVGCTCAGVGGADVQGANVPDSRKRAVRGRRYTADGRTCSRQAGRTSR